MSPRIIARPDDDAGFPRVSGDEPGSYPPNLMVSEFSPRERG